MSADSHFKAYIDRILRCREAEDDAKEDTKAVYAEMKADGYDKTIVGKLVAELRSREKNSEKMDEQAALLDLYRDAYHRASHTHAREAASIPHQAAFLHAPETGRVLPSSQDTWPVTNPSEAE